MCLGRACTLVGRVGKPLGRCGHDPFFGFQVAKPPSSTRPDALLPEVRQQKVWLIRMRDGSNSMIRTPAGRRQPTGAGKLFPQRLKKACPPAGHEGVQASHPERASCLVHGCHPILCLYVMHFMSCTAVAVRSAVCLVWCAPPVASLCCFRCQRLRWTQP